MKHASSQILFDHWTERRGRHGLPERTAIDPGAIRGSLGDTFILSFNRRGGHPVRLAGTRVCALAGGAMKDQPFAELFRREDRDELMRLVDLVADESIGLIAGAVASTEEGLSLGLELLVLPLAHWGRTHARLIGVLAPVKVPAWFGTQRLGAFALGSYRYIGMRPAAPAPTLAPVPVFEPSAGRVRHGLVVIDGGQA